MSRPIVEALKIGFEMKLKIESTETGEVFNMRMESRFVELTSKEENYLTLSHLLLNPPNTSIDKLKFQVSLLIPIPPHDQIMLIGPPYKILDSLVRVSMSFKTYICPIRSLFLSF